MKKHEIIKHAYENYPKGTVYTWAKDTLPREVTSSGKFYFQKNELDNDLELHDQEDKDLPVWNGEKWAEIVKSKIAVKVENEKEFKALMKYYDSLGWKSWGDHNIDGSFNIGDCIDFHDEYRSTYKSIQENQGYQIIPFADFDEEKGIKLPRITTHDGVDLYIGDYVACVWKDEGEWKLTKEYSSIHSNTVNESVQKNLEDERKLFSSKQAALDWIEAQKPKEKYLHIGSTTLIINKSSVNRMDNISWLSKEDIEFILKSMNEL